MVILTPEQVRQWDQLSDLVLSTGLKAKFSQHHELKRQFILERVRADLFFEEEVKVLNEGRITGMKRVGQGAILADKQGMEYYVKYNPETNQIFPL